MYIKTRNTHHAQAMDGTSPRKGVGYLDGQPTGHSSGAVLQPANGAGQYPQHSGCDRRMHAADGGCSDNSSNSDSDSCRSGVSDGEDEAMPSARAGADGRAARESPKRSGTWSAVQSVAVKQEASQERGSGGARGSGNNSRTKKPHLKVSCFQIQHDASRLCSCRTVTRNACCDSVRQELVSAANEVPLARPGALLGAAGNEER